MLRRLFLAVTAALIGLGPCSPALAQEATRAMVLGTWEGKVSFGESARAVLEFSERAGTIRWTYRFRYDPVLWGDAEGTVTAEMNNTPLEISLTRKK
jgi:hypothetical protein